MPQGDIVRTRQTRWIARPGASHGQRPLGFGNNTTGHKRMSQCHGPAAFGPAFKGCLGLNRHGRVVVD
jgi:hypothetical protein